MPLNRVVRLEVDVGKAIRTARKARGWTLEELAIMAGTDTGNLSRLERGIQGVSQDLLERILSALGISLSESITSQTIATNTTGRSGPNSSPLPLVPILSWVNAGNWVCVMDDVSAAEAQQWIACPVSHGRRTFALTVRGESMFNPLGERSFKDGDVIYVDPDRQADNKSLVVVMLEGAKEATFKQLIIEGDSQYLKPLNPAWPEPVIRLPDDAVICGVVIFKGEFI